MSNDPEGCEDAPESKKPKRPGAKPSGFLPNFNPLANYYDDLLRPVREALTGAAAFKVKASDSISPQVLDSIKETRRSARITSGVQEALESINKQYLKQWQDLFESIGRTAARIYPENWDGITPPSTSDLETILIDEGIPLMWVPGPKVVEALSEVEDAPARRRIVGSRWKGIISDCEAVLKKIDHPDLLDERDFALDCVRAIRAGHSNPAQALAANLLDTALCHLDEKDRKELTNNRFKQEGVRFDWDDYLIREAFTFAPVWCAHARFFVKKGDTIPRTFGRHPSVHAVSRTQYKRINAVIGIMLVTSVLKFFDLELDR